MKELLKKAADGKDLTRAEAAAAMDMMLEGKVSPVLTAAFLTALRMKGETIEEIVGCTEMMKSKGGTVKLNTDDYIDFVGTGGDGTNTFNISTTSMFVCAAAGVTVAKHGNRASSSKSGASDLLEALGANIMLEPEQVEKCINEIGIGFLNAQKFHKAMKNVAPVRKEIGIRTIFNMLGPLSNPSGSTRQVIGVYGRDRLPVFSKVMSTMGVRRAMIVHGSDGMDEITVTGKTYINEIKGDEILEYELDPKDYGIEYAAPEELVGGDGAENAEITKRIFAGEKGAKRDIVLMNSAAGIYMGGKADTYKDAIEIAKDMIDSGKAAQKLNEFVEYTNKF
ncbi:MAG: anthranilate phosphoribosyltransferase [Firmicutes bacterium]|nr:anthranilate phosphoribosyltransferase [Bacillota bacterium]